MAFRKWLASVGEWIAIDRLHRLDIVNKSLGTSMSDDRFQSQAWALEMASQNGLITSEPRPCGTALLAPERLQVRPRSEESSAHSTAANLGHSFSVQSPIDSMRGLPNVRDIAHCRSPRPPPTCFDEERSHSGRMTARGFLANQDILPVSHTNHEQRAITQERMSSEKELLVGKDHNMNRQFDTTRHFSQSLPLFNTDTAGTACTWPSAQPTQSDLARDCLPQQGLTADRSLIAATAMADLEGMRRDDCLHQNIGIRDDTQDGLFDLIDWTAELDFIHHSFQQCFPDIAAYAKLARIVEDTRKLDFDGWPRGPLALDGLIRARGANLRQQFGPSFVANELDFPQDLVSCFKEAMKEEMVRTPSPKLTRRG